MLYFNLNSVFLCFLFFVFPSFLILFPFFPFWILKSIEIDFESAFHFLSLFPFCLMASPPAIERGPQGSLMCILGGSPRESRREKKENNNNNKKNFQICPLPGAVIWRGLPQSSLADTLFSGGLGCWLAFSLWLNSWRGRWNTKIKRIIKKGRRRQSRKTEPACVPRFAVTTCWPYTKLVPPQQSSARYYVWASVLTADRCMEGDRGERLPQGRLTCTQRGSLREEETKTEP